MKIVQNIMKVNENLWFGIQKYVFVFESDFGNDFSWKINHMTNNAKFHVKNPNVSFQKPIFDQEIDSVCQKCKNN